MNATTTMTRDERQELFTMLFEALPGLNQPLYQSMLNSVVEDLAVNAVAMVEGLANELPDEDPDGAVVGEPPAPAMDERNRIQRFAEQHAKSLRRAVGGPREFVALWDRCRARNPRLTAADFLSPMTEREVWLESQVMTFSERRAHRGYQLSRLDKFCEMHADFFTKYGHSRETLKRAFGDLLNRRPDSVLEGFVGHSAAAN